MMKKKWIAAASLVTTAAALTLGGAYYGYRTAFSGDKRFHAPVRYVPDGAAFDPYREKMLDGIDRICELPFERWTITSHDGLKLVGKFYEGEKGKPVVLFFHGYRSSAERDSSGGAQFCREKGYSMLLVDQRCHGESEGRTITFGIQERQDCKGWAEEIVDRLGTDVKILLAGVSMGAATVLSASELDLPEQVKGIWADCGYATTADVLRHTARRWGWPEWPAYQLVKLGARLYGGFSPEECSPVEAVKHTDLPILLVQGTEDTMVPCEMASEIQTACKGPVTLVTVRGAEHGISFYVDTPTYRAALEKFCADIF